VDDNYHLRFILHNIKSANLFLFSYLNVFFLDSIQILTTEKNNDGSDLALGGEKEEKTVCVSVCVCVCVLGINIEEASGQQPLGESETFKKRLTSIRRRQTDGRAAILVVVQGSKDPECK